MQAAPRAVEVATALYVAVFNIGIALGAWAGGWIVDAQGLATNLGVAAGLAALGLLLALRMK
ncbi:putative arabinose transporter [compost metagenome]